VAVGRVDEAGVSRERVGAEGVKIKAMVDVNDGKIGVLEGRAAAVLRAHGRGDEGPAGCDMSAEVLQCAVTLLPAGGELGLPLRRLVVDGRVDREGDQIG